MDFTWFSMPLHGFRRLPPDSTGCQLIPPVVNRFSQLPTAAAPTVELACATQIMHAASCTAGTKITRVPKTILEKYVLYLSMTMRRENGPD